MKKFFTLNLLSVLLVLVVTTTASAQYEYWREGFNNNPGSIISSSTLASSTPTDAIGDAGTWVISSVYRTTGSACPGYGPGHIRSLKTSDASTPWFASPFLPDGVKEVHYASSGNNKRIAIQVTTSTATDAAGVAAATWTAVTGSPFQRGTCTGDTIISINNSAARRIRFVVETNYQVDIDSVWVVSTSGSGPVPVRFGAVNVANSNGMNKITWNSETELNTKEYVIERSVDGVNFVSAGIVSATGAGKYVWMDNALLSGNVYYRIQGLDQSGSSNYSSVVKVASTQKTFGLNVAPNPVRNGQMNLQMTNFTKGSYTINLYNSASQKVFTRSITLDGGSSVQQVQLSAGIKGGMYSLQLIGESVKLTKSLVIE